MRALAPAAAAFTSLAIVTAFASSARAQSANDPSANPHDEIAPIEIVATPPPAPPAPAEMNHGTYSQSFLDRPAGATTSTRITSLAGRVEIAFAPADRRLPSESEIRYLCFTPCEVSLPLGWYHFVARSEEGRFRRYVNVAPHMHFYVTPRQSRALANGLLVPGIITGIVGFIMIVPSAIFAASSFPPSNTGAMWIATGSLLAGGAAFTIGGAYFMHDTGGAVRTAPEGAPLPWRRNPTAGVVPITSGAIAVAAIRF